MSTGMAWAVTIGETTRATLLLNSENGNPLLMEVLTLWGKHAVAVYAPWAQMVREAYVPLQAHASPR